MTDAEFKKVLITELIAIREAIDGLNKNLDWISKNVSEINKAQARILMFVESLHMWQTAAIAKGG